MRMAQGHVSNLAPAAMAASCGSRASSPSATGRVFQGGVSPPSGTLGQRGTSPQSGEFGDGGGTSPAEGPQNPGNPSHQRVEPAPVDGASPPEGPLRQGGALPPKGDPPPRVGRAPFRMLPPPPLTQRPPAEQPPSRKRRRKGRKVSLPRASPRRLAQPLPPGRCPEAVFASTSFRWQWASALGRAPPTALAGPHCANECFRGQLESSLWLGNADHAAHLGWCQSRSLAMVVCCVPGDIDSVPPVQASFRTAGELGIRWLQFSIVWESCLQTWERSLRPVYDCLSKPGHDVLVHCRSGLSGGAEPQPCTTDCDLKFEGLHKFINVC